MPRIIPTFGLIGAPLLLTAMLATYFGIIDQVSPVSGILTLPVAAWELSVGLWMTFKGFNPSSQVLPRVAWMTRKALRTRPDGHYDSHRRRRPRITGVALGAVPTWSGSVNESGCESRRTC